MLSNFCQIFGGGSDLGEDSIFYLLRLLLISFHSFIEKKEKILIHPSKKEARNATFLFSSHHIKSLRSVPANVRSRHIYFLRKEQPSVRRALPPVGWQRTVEQPAQMTTVWACEKTVVMVKQPGHLTSMKKERGWGTRVCCEREEISNQSWDLGGPGVWCAQDM